jgi:hypothetical protein
MASWTANSIFGEADLYVEPDPHRIAADSSLSVNDGKPADERK